MELLARLLLELPPGTRSVTQRKYRELIAGRSYPWPDGLRRAVKAENARRRTSGISGDLTMGDLWAAAARRTAQLRRRPEPVEPPPAGQLDRAHVICRFARQHQRWPLKKKMEAFAERESLVVRAPHGSHADYLAEAERLLRRDDPAAFAAVQRAEEAAAAAKRERARKQRADARTRYRARRRARATPLQPRGAPKGIPRADAIAQFADEQEALPSEGMLRYWARHVKGMSLAQPARSHAVELACVRRSRRRAGKSIPSRVLTLRDRGLLRSSSSQRPAIAVRTREWPAEACLAAVPSVVAAAAGGPLTIDLWRELTRGRSDLPSYNTVRKRVKETYGMTFAEYVSSF